MQKSQFREAGIIHNPIPPSPLLKMSTPEHHLPDLHNNRDNQFNARQTTSPPIAPPLLTSNGYVTHDAIIGKVIDIFIICNIFGISKFYS